MFIGRYGAKQVPEYSCLYAYSNNQHYCTSVTLILLLPLKCYGYCLDFSVFLAPLAILFSRPTTGFGSGPLFIDYSVS